MADRNIKQEFLNNLYLAFRGQGLKEHTYDAHGELVQDAVTGTFDGDTRTGELTFVFKPSIEHSPITQEFSYPYESVSGFREKLYTVGGEIIKTLNQKYRVDDYERFLDQITD